MRRTVPMTALVLAVTLIVGVQPAQAARLVEQIPGYQRVDLAPFCADSRDVVDQRDPRTLTTVTDRRGAVLLQTLKTRTTDLFTRADGAVMDLEERSVITVRPDPRGGDRTIVWVGRGALWGTEAGTPFLVWVTGVAIMRGGFEPKTGVYTLNSMTIAGQRTDLCEAIDEGLKPRH
jgi:hypothetical protein